MRILWIEDQSKEEEFFPKRIFSSHEIDRENKFDDAFKKISLKTEKYDFFVIDIDLSESLIEKSEKARSIIKKHYKFIKDSKEAQNKFKKEAGYHLAVELIHNKGFPLNRVVFLTGNTSDEDDEYEKAIYLAFDKLSDGLPVKEELETLRTYHDDPQNEEMDEAEEKGELDDFLRILEEKITNRKNTYQNLKNMFRKAYMEMPEAISKSKKEDFHQWFENVLKPPIDNKRGKKNLDYLTLRRGIINVLDRLEKDKTKLTKDFLNDRDPTFESGPRFDKLTFIRGLRIMFKAHELSQIDEETKLNEEEKYFYTIVCDFLTKPFEMYHFNDIYKLRGNEPDGIEKRSHIFSAFFMRNWIAHGLFDSKKTPPLSAKEAGFTFLVAIKGLFQIGLEIYEHNNELKLLFGDLEEDYNIFLDEVVKLHNTTYSMPKTKDKLKLISDLGKKNESFLEEYKKGKMSEKVFKAKYWNEQNFISHFYASYLFASIDYLGAEGYDVEEKENEFKVSMYYKLFETSYLAIAYKRLQEIKKFT